MQDSCNNFGGECSNFHNTSGVGDMPTGSTSTSKEVEKKWWEKATDWATSDKVKNAADTISKTADKLKPYLGKDGKTIVNPKAGDSGQGGGTGEQEVKILGMSPVTFGIVSVLVLLVGGIITYKLIKK